MSERCVRSAFAAMCAYEAAAIASRRAPTVSMLCRRHRWAEAALLGFLLVHLHHAAKEAACDTMRPEVNPRCATR